MIESTLFKRQIDGIFIDLTSNRHYFDQSFLTGFVPNQHEGSGTLLLSLYRKSYAILRYNNRHLDVKRVESGEFTATFPS